MKIQPATIEDSAVIYQIAQAAFQTSPWPKTVFEHELNSPRSRYFLTTGGFIGITQILDEVEIGSIAVQPDYQRQGIAQALLATVLALPDVARFLLEVDLLNHPAIQLYEKMGFSPYHRRRSIIKMVMPQS